MSDYVTAEGVKQCSKCGDWKAQSKFSSSTKTNDGKQAWCKRCHKEYKATIGKKATKFIKQLPSSGEYVDALLDELRANNVILRIVPNDDSLAKQRKAVGPEFDKQWRWVDGYLKKRRMEKIGAIIDAAFSKAETQARIDHANIQIAKSKASIAKSREQTRLATIQVNDAVRARQVAVAQMERNVAELQKRVDVVTTNYHRAADQVFAQQARNTAMADQREAADRDDWLVKATSTNDPILRAAYMARAEGQDFEDDDDE